jgi:hypothetical protein
LTTAAVTTTGIVIILAMIGKVLISAVNAITVQLDIIAMEVKS